jgi:HSP20 family protein
MQLVPHRAQALRSVFGLGREFERALDELFEGRTRSGELEYGQWIPTADVKQTDDAVEVWMDLPGMSKDEVDILVEGNRLSIKGERKREKSEEGENWYINERFFGTFHRTFVLPAELDPSKAAASYREGVLHISIPKLEEAKPRRLQIKAG